MALVVTGDIGAGEDKARRDLSMTSVVTGDIGVGEDKA